MLRTDKKKCGVITGLTFNLLQKEKFSYTRNQNVLAARPPNQCKSIIFAILSDHLVHKPTCHFSPFLISQVSIMGQVCAPPKFPLLENTPSPSCLCVLDLSCSLLQISNTKTVLAKRSHLTWR